MSYIPKTISEVISEYLNRHTFLPAIQREYVWGTYNIEKLFDSIMGDYPISTFLFWKIREENKKDWIAYEFIRDYDKELPHNKEASLKGVNQDIYLVLDGQQRLTSLLIGLKGTYRYSYYRWYKTRLYMNILKAPVRPEDPEEFTYQFQFREGDKQNLKDPTPQYWYMVGNILDFEDAEEAKKSIKADISGFSDEQKDIANTHIGRLHSRIHTSKLLNYYEEKSQDYNKVVEAFIRANTGGVKLEYSDILLSTATAKWKNLNAREEIQTFTDNINSIGTGYTFGKDFVLKGSLFLTDGLPIQYQVKNFTTTNLEKIETNWDSIKDNIETSVKLASKFGFTDKNLVAKIALLPIAFYLKKLNKGNFVESSIYTDVQNQVIIKKWLAIVLLKSAFSSSSDTTLKSVQDAINAEVDYTLFPYHAINLKLNIEAKFSETEIENLLSINYATKNSYLILSLLYPDRDWKDNKYHEDHIFPKSEFTSAKLKARGYNDDKVEQFQKYYNCILNLQLLSDKENLEKMAHPFDSWFSVRDTNFIKRHTIPIITSYRFDNFIEFVTERKKLISNELNAISL